MSSDLRRQAFPERWDQYINTYIYIAKICKYLRKLVVFSISFGLLKETVLLWLPVADCRLIFAS